MESTPTIHKWLSIPVKPNDRWGTISAYEKPGGTFRFGHQNINGIPFLQDGLNFGLAFYKVGKSDARLFLSLRWILSGCSRIVRRAWEWLLKSWWGTSRQHSQQVCKNLTNHGNQAALCFAYTANAPGVSLVKTPTPLEDGDSFKSVANPTLPSRFSWHIEYHKCPTWDCSPPMNNNRQWCLQWEELNIAQGMHLSLISSCTSFHHKQQVTNIDMHRRQWRNGNWQNQHCKTDERMRAHRSSDSLSHWNSATR